MIQRWQTDVVSTLKYGYLFNVTIRILIFQASLYKNKTVFRVNPKSTLNQWIEMSWIVELSMNQRWQIDVESTWISGWVTSRRCFNIYQRWINVECLLECTFLSYQWINVDIRLSDVTTLFQHISTLNQRWVFAGVYIFELSVLQNPFKNYKFFVYNLLWFFFKILEKPRKELIFHLQSIMKRNL